MSPNYDRLTINPHKMDEIIDGEIPPKEGLQAKIRGPSLWPRWPADQGRSDSLSEVWSHCWEGPAARTIPRLPCSGWSRGRGSQLWEEDTCRHQGSAPLGGERPGRERQALPARPAEVRCPAGSRPGVQGGCLAARPGALLPLGEPGFTVRIV